MHFAAAFHVPSLIILTEKRNVEAPFLYPQNLHVRDADGRLFTGVDGFWAIWQAFPEGSRYRLMGRVVTLPGIRAFARAGYALFSRYRHLLPKVSRAYCSSLDCHSTKSRRIGPRRSTVGLKPSSSAEK